MSTRGDKGKGKVQATSLTRKRQRQGQASSQISQGQMFRNAIHSERYDRLRDRSCICGRTIKWFEFHGNSLRVVEEWLKSVEWLGIANIAEKRYSPSLVRQFYSGIALNKKELGSRNDLNHDCLYTYLNGEEVVLTVDELGDLLGIPSEGVCMMPDDFDGNSAWRNYSGRDECHIKDVSAAYRFLHHFIATSIECKTSSLTFVTIEELWLMECVTTGTTINLARYLMQRMQNVLVSHSGNLPYANIITFIAQPKNLLSERYIRDLTVKATEYTKKSIGLMDWKLEYNERIRKSFKAAEIPAQQETLSAPSQPSLEMIVQMIQGMETKLGQRMDTLESNMNERFDSIHANIAQLHEDFQPGGTYSTRTGGDGRFKSTARKSSSLQHYLPSSDSP